MKNFRWNYALPHEDSPFSRDYVAMMIASFVPPMYAVVNEHGRIFFNASSGRAGASGRGSGFAYAYAEIEPGDDVEVLARNVELLFEVRYGRPT